jgi:hypothetical protein
MAMLIALVALLLTSALATAVLAAARVRWLSGSRQLAARRALEAAAGSSARHRAQWDDAVATSMTLGQTIGLPGPSLGAGLRNQDSLTRVDSSIYLIRSAVQVVSADGFIQARDGVAELVEVEADGRARGARRLPGGWWRWP